MGAILRRAIVPALLVIGGAASIIYGAMFHRAPVLVEQETTTTIEIPTDFGPPPQFGQGGPLSGDAPFGMPPLSIKKEVTRIDVITRVESEAALTREVSIGGVALLPSGELKRTYSGKGPALCPS